MIGLLIAQNRRRLLWRVRRKLLLSYLFLSVVPIVLVLTFALAGAVVLYDTLTAYLLRQGIDEVVVEVQAIADSAAAEIDLNPGAAAEMVSARYEHWSSRFPGLSIAIVPVGGAGRGDLPRAGPGRGRCRRARHQPGLDDHCASAASSGRRPTDKAAGTAIWVSSFGRPSRLELARAWW